MRFFPHLKMPWPKKAFHWTQVVAVTVSLALLMVLTLGGFSWLQTRTIIGNLQTARRGLEAERSKILKELAALKNEDQYKKNEKLQKEIKDIEEQYKKSVDLYESLLSLKQPQKLTASEDELYAKAVRYLSERNFASAAATLTALEKSIVAKRTASNAGPSAPVNNAPPGSGASLQTVQTDAGNFTVNIIAGDLNSMKVVVDTASEGTCTDSCPVMALGDYAARSGAFAAINGPYFCPAEYPSCAGKTNSFDTLLMNKNKTYFNSDNNVYSTVPAVIFSGNSARWVRQSLEWGRDTGVDAVIANQPLLIFNNEIVFGGDEEAKRAGKGTRSFIATKGSTVYIGVVYSANVAEVAIVLKKLGMENALNLDSGGSIALWSGGRYLAGPGRALPFGILFVGK